ncbi:MAG: hypothetical protein KKB23_01205, partial [Proteobacteria bacterium]|nr:hypothetical protein [Pseudomonadota bacterium]
MKNIRLLLYFLLIAGLAAWAVVSCAHKPARFAKRCVECHQEKIAVFKDNKVVHSPVSKGTCESCHRPHGIIGGVYLKTDEKKLCYKCHPDSMKIMEKKHIHAPVKDEKCVSCHNPHASMNKNLLKEKDYELCFICHNKEQFERKTRHELKKECIFCHKPHSSDYENLLFDSVNNVCAECHNFKDKGFIKGHSGYDASGASCVSCHASHSSNNDKLLRNFIHKPLDKNQCNDCHGAPGASLKIEEKGAEFCYKCHKEAEKAFVKNHIHSPVSKGNCLDCHSPHS